MKKNSLLKHISNDAEMLLGFKNKTSKKNTKRKKAVSLAEMKRKNKKTGEYFFQRGLPPVLEKRGDVLITRSMSGTGKVAYKYNRKTGRIQYLR